MQRLGRVEADESICDVQCSFIWCGWNNKCWIINLPLLSKHLLISCRWHSIWQLICVFEPSLLPLKFYAANFNENCIWNSRLSFFFFFGWGAAWGGGRGGCGGLTFHITKILEIKFSYKFFHAALDYGLQVRVDSWIGWRSFQNIIYSSVYFRNCFGFQ